MIGFVGFCKKNSMKTHQFRSIKEKLHQNSSITLFAKLWKRLNLNKLRSKAEGLFHSFIRDGQSRVNFCSDCNCKRPSQWRSWRLSRKFEYKFYCDFFKRDYDNFNNKIANQCKRWKRSNWREKSTSDDGKLKNRYRRGNHWLESAMKNKFCCEINFVTKINSPFALIKKNCWPCFFSCLNFVH